MERKYRNPSKRDTRIAAAALSDLVSGLGRLIRDENILEDEKGERLLAVVMSNEWDAFAGLVSELGLHPHFVLELLQRFNELCYELDEDSVKTYKIPDLVILRRLEESVRLDVQFWLDHDKRGPSMILLCSCCDCSNIVSLVKADLLRIS
jgi:hypothetical protein